MKLNVAVSRLRSRLGITLVVLAATIAAAVALNHSAPTSVADQNPNNTLCKGHIDKGKADPDDPDSGVVSYTFACSQPITGYSVMPDKAATGFETEVFGTDPATKEVLATDAFSCAGEQPGWGVNCTGADVGSWHPITSTFTIDGDVCTEPRVDPLLLVTFATVTAGKAAQYIAGPFDLGRPRGCPKSSRNGKTRIPADTTESTTGDVAPIS
ncbi:hypothetical protein [Baekduia sp.]|uniref:hypothetical protein n=1 Tax=Baekduia sp. TaxID=2600305 RepID=UPI002DFE5A8E|nr:hypothetical protein [Baekduia sp.]